MLNGKQEILNECFLIKMSRFISHTRRIRVFYLLCHIKQFIFFFYTYMYVQMYIDLSGEYYSKSIRIY